MKNLGLFLATLAAGAATPALAADDHMLFLYSPYGTQTLTLNSNTIGAPQQSGWFSDTGEHWADNTNYAVGMFPSGFLSELRNFFTFDVGNGVTSASVTIGNEPSLGFLSTNGQALRWTLYDVSSTIDTSLGYSGAAGQAIFNDLGTGTVYGSVLVSGPTSSVTVTFNAAGIAAINAAGDGGNPFTFGGRITVGGVPEPTSWAMMIAGFGLVGAAMRRRSAALTA